MKKILIALILIMMIPLAYGIDGFDLDWYVDFNDIHGFTDRTGNYLNTSHYNQSSGVACKSASCDFNNKGGVSYNFNLSGLTDVMIWCWASNDGWDGPDVRETIFGMPEVSEGGTNGIRFFTNMHWAIYTSGSLTENDIPLSVGDEMTLWTWRYVDGDNLRTYINTTPQISVITSGDIDLTTDEFEVGGTFGHNGFDWDGNISSCGAELNYTGNITIDVTEIFNKGHGAVYEDFFALPPIINITSPTNHSRVNTLNIDVSVDKPSSCVLMNSSFDILDTENTNLTSTLSSSLPLDQDYDDIFLINCSDYENSLHTIASLNLSIDTINPILTINQPLNNTIYSGIFNVSLDCVDNDIFRLNYTFFNSSDIISTKENLTPTNNNLKIINTIDTSFLGDDNNIDFNIECSDSHTTKIINNYLITKDNIGKQLKYKTDNYEEIIIESEDKLDVNDFSTWKSVDRYKFEYNYKQSLGVYNFRLKANGLIHLPKSDYSCHFVTRKNWIDFELQGDGLSTCKVTKLDIDDYRITITTTLKDLVFKSIGDLNLVEKFLKLEIDNTAPDITANISASGFFTNENATFTINCLDNNVIDELRVYHNVTGNGSISLNLTLDNPTFPLNYGSQSFLGNYSFRFECVDIVDNIASSSILTFYGMTPPATLTTNAGLPLETPANIVGMLFLFFTVFGLIIALTKGGKK